VDFKISNSRSTRSYTRIYSSYERSRKGENYLILIMCLDMAFSNIGVSIFCDDALVFVTCIKTKKTKNKKTKVSVDNLSRAEHIIIQLMSLIRKYKITKVISELPSGSQSAKAANLLGMATGILVGVNVLSGVEYDYVTPTEVKKALCNNRFADKDEMIESVKRKYPYFDFPKQKNQMEHIADSIGVKEAYYKKILTN
jgi:Holliday junction resolvasome RuvABC endonuclease subunit